MFRTNFPFVLGILLTFVFSSCQKSSTVDFSDPGLVRAQDRVFYLNKPFEGIIRTEIPALGETQFAHYKNGMEDGEFISRNQSGQVLERRRFEKGQKVGIHRAWFPNGNNRFYSEFKNGKYTNDRWEWHDNGKPFLYEKYDEDGKILVSKKWNRNGQIYMNTVIATDGSSFGLPGSKICEPIKKSE
ncbi:hypothetical protein JWG45_03850 [Leptospira sp. 201903070]|uniref:Toxin-antitoxin system YwqK family antitoxin n=1 Tax=Leptospira ainlahdjerensis TaxID=2810033 RepID=A0ABS2U7D8_9LEPT|nr:hypothetical protein [Leptospira ainlahdjerensis]